MQADHDYDLLIVGGGINGAGIARDAAGRGLRVVLCEQGDLAGATSWASSKLIHGGLRYLEQGQFRLVREALSEREILLRTAAHLVTPLRLVLPHVDGMRPSWMIRLGLWFYDHLGHRGALAGSESIALTPELGLDTRLRRGYEYSDAQVDDARLVVCNAVDARLRGATILVGAQVGAACAEAGGWHVSVTYDGRISTVRARALVNAAGPWAVQVLERAGVDDSRGKLRLVRGSHIVVARKSPPRGLLLQHTDDRVVFVLPMAADFTLIGTTDVEVEAPGEAIMSAAERDYLIDVVNRYLAQPISNADIVWSYAGLRALYDDGARGASRVTRDYVLQLDRVDGAPCLSVLGGKITTYRRLAEQAVDRLAPLLGTHAGAWTAHTPLPGADMPGGPAALLDALRRARPTLPAATLAGMIARHGSRVDTVLGEARDAEALGCDFGAGLTQREIDHFIAHEWARSGDDVLWRRSKCGLRMTSVQRAAVGDYVQSRVRDLAATNAAIDH